MTSMMGYRGPTGGNLTGARTGQLNRPGDSAPKGYTIGQLQQFTPEQLNLFKSLFSNVSPGSYTSRLAQGDQELFDELEEPQLRQFNDLQSGIANRFSGMGLGGQKSSGFRNNLTAASSNFSQQLGSQRMGLQRQALQDLMGMSSSLLNQRPYERDFFAKPESGRSFFQELLAGLTGGIGQGIGQLPALLMGG